MKSMTVFYIAICAGSVFLPVPTVYTPFAYIDPAATSYIIQIVAAVIVSLGALIGVFWNKIKRFFRKKKYSECRTDENISYQEPEEIKSDYISAEDILKDANKEEE